MASQALRLGECKAMSQSSGDKSKNVNPLSWDFVPDGLLVWKAWKEWISKND